MNSQDQGFPGTSDTRTAEEVEQHIRADNLRLADFERAAISKHEADKVAQEPDGYVPDGTEPTELDDLEHRLVEMTEERDHWRALCNTNLPSTVAEVVKDGATVRLQWASVEAAHNAKPGPLYTHPAPTTPAAQERETTFTDRHEIAWTDKDGVHHCMSIEAARELLERFWDEWPGGWSDVESEQRTRRAAQERAEPVAPAVQKGWKLVPMEPTSNMLAAMSGEWHSSRHGKAREQYAAMLYAAPTEPSKPEQAEAPLHTVCATFQWRDRCSECRAKSVPATLPPASAAGEGWGMETVTDAMGGRMFSSAQIAKDRAALATKPQAEQEAAKVVPADILKYAKSMQKQGYSGPLMWASKIIDWVVEQDAARASNSAKKGGV